MCEYVCVCVLPVGFFTVQLWSWQWENRKPRHDEYTVFSLKMHFAVDLKKCWSLTPALFLCSHLQVQICSLTARRSVRPWATLIAAGCQVLWPPMGAKAQTTAATSMCQAWTPSQTQRYLKVQSKWQTSHSPPLAKRRLSVTNISTTTTFSVPITLPTSKAP